MFICHFGISMCHQKIIQIAKKKRENYKVVLIIQWRIKSIEYVIVDGVEGTIKMRIKCMECL